MGTDSEHTEMKMMPHLLTSTLCTMLCCNAPPHENSPIASAWKKWFRVQGLGFRVQGLGFRVQGLGFRV